MTQQLSPEHLKALVEGSGIALDVIEERGYRTCTGYSELKSLGITIRRDTDTRGLLLPLHTVTGKPGQTYLAKEDRSVPLMVYRPDIPQIDQEGHPQKYLYPGSQHMRLDCHPRAFPRLGDPAVPLWVTEGIKKGDALVAHDLCALALLGVWNWRGTNTAGGKMALPDWHDVALSGRDVRLVFDSDIVEKPGVAHALQELSGMLTTKGAHVHVAYLPSAEGEKVGIDDYLLTHTVAEVERLLEAPRPRRRGRTTAGDAIKDLKLSKDLYPRPILFNVMQVLTQDPDWKDVLHFNAFSRKVELHAAPPGITAAEPWQRRTLRDTDTSLVTNWIQEKYEIFVSSVLVQEALNAVASTKTYHPIQDYLNALTWDGTPRLETLLVKYFHAEPSLYTAAVGAKTLIGAVARSMDPGCHLDTMLILQGKQGLYKSTGFRTLVGPAWFGDDMPRDLGSKDAKSYLDGRWIIEFADLSQFKRSEWEEVKAFVSTRVDWFRSAYGRNEHPHERSCVFVGTTNHDACLSDETGNRRFWPVTVHGVCDLDALARDRNQLWAEAVHRYRQGEPWYLTGEVQVHAEAEQAARVAVDPWTTPIINYLSNNLLRKLPYKGQNVPTITTNELLEFALKLDTVHWTSGANRRIAAILRLHGWGADKVENPEKEKTDQPRQIRVFVRETDESDRSASSTRSVSAPPPLKTLRETDETHDTDSQRMYRERESSDISPSHDSLYTHRKSSESSASSVSDAAMLDISIAYSETDARVNPSAICLTSRVHLSQTPASPQDLPLQPASDAVPCPGCGYAIWHQRITYQECLHCGYKDAPSPQEIRGDSL